MVTMKDIASEAGVSQTTVSFVLNNNTKYEICENTKIKVIAAADTLGYRVNQIARSMVTGKTKIISFISSAINREYTSNIIQGMLNEVQKKKYFLNLTTYNPYYYRNNYNEIINPLLETRPSGIICHSVPCDFIDVLQKTLKIYKIPLAIAGPCTSNNCSLNVCQGDVKGSLAAIEYLYTLGHRNIGFVCNTLDYDFARFRNHGYMQATEILGLEVRKDNLIYSDNEEQIEKLLKKMFSRKSKRPTAVFCTSDMFAMLAIRAGQSLGLRVPDDLSVIGFANLAMVKYSNPPLTSVAEPFEQIGITIIKELVNIIESEIKPEIPLKIELDEKLVIRNSTKEVKK